MNDSNAVVERADRLISAPWLNLRRDFLQLVAAEKSVFVKNNSYGGSACREHIHLFCATQLHVRVTLALENLWASHAAMSAPPSDACRSACKDWIARRINAEAEDLQQHLPWFHPAYAVAGRDDNPRDDLLAEARREIESASAEIDNTFDRLFRDRIERALRWCVRSLRFVGVAIGVARSV